ncbi:MAG: hypothetical protein K2G06_06690, partial [Muribaculaceae bacterium]|nr:hypothetical protein [Muribaculaceae bacterium]
MDSTVHNRFRLSKTLWLNWIAAVNRAEWGREVVINPYFSLIKIAGNFLEMELPANIDAVYYDAF